MSGAIIRLGLLVLVLAGISRVQLWRADTGSSVMLAAGALLLCGLFAGKVAKGVGLPRLTGYLLVGVVVGPYALGFIPGEGVKGLELVKGLAVSLIALVAGTELHLGLIRRVGVKVALLCAGVCGVTFVVAFSALFALRPLLPFLAAMTVPQALATSALVSTVVVSFSPTVTIAIV
jgi:Kef-type K+ transport system membrane component KefB